MAPRKAQDGLTTNGRVGLGGEGGHKGRPYRRRVGRGWVLDGSRAGLGRRHYARVGRGRARREEGERTVGWGGAGSNGGRRYARSVGCWWGPGRGRWDDGMGGMGTHLREMDAAGLWFDSPLRKTPGRLTTNVAVGTGPEEGGSETRPYVRLGGRRG